MVTHYKDDLIEQYGQLEMAVQKEMIARCVAYCTTCTSPCCRIDFCRESLETPFLEAVRHRFAPHAAWDVARGWLTDRGCCLAAGRPPVCYEFLCAPILSAQKSRNDLDRLKQLAMMITLAGRRARGNHHIVALTDLSRVNWTRLSAQLVKARKALLGSMSR